MSFLPNAMPGTFDAHQIRVLGALIEKEITTPESYPLSLNALVNACNQRSSRDPVLDLTEEEVRQTIHSLEERDLVAAVRNSRVPKYEHRARTVWNLRRDETAVLCLLMLRGPQTPGELRSRSDRLYSFDDLAAVQSTLERLAARMNAANSEEAVGTGPLTLMLERQPGSRESRYTHLLSPVSHSHPASPTGLSRATAHRTDLEPDPTNDSHLRHSAAQVETRLDAVETTLKALTEKIEALEGTIVQLHQVVHELDDRIARLEANLSTAPAS